MATNFLTPNMNLLVPVVGAELSPTWAQDLNTSLGTIDGHNHASGSGVQINPNGLNINAALTFHGNQALNVGFVGISAQASGIPTPINDSLYVSGVDLYYQDGNGNAVQITSGGTVNATSSGISSGTATASFVSSVLVVDQSVGVGAPIDAASYILRYNGSYPSPSGNAIVLAAPSSLSGTYQLTFPAAVPSSNGAFLTESTAGTLSYTNVDNSTLAISGGVVSVQPGIISSLAANARSGGQNIVVSNTNSASQLAIVRGAVSSTGAVVTGEGFTSVRTGTGLYTITYTTAFASSPVVTITTQNAFGTNDFAMATSVTTTSVNVEIVNLSGTNTNDLFFFIAIGPIA